MLAIEKENSGKCFRWRGTWHEIFTGEHGFRFEASGETEGGTTFIHEEKFSGLLGPMMGEGFTARSPGFGRRRGGGLRGSMEILRGGLRGVGRSWGIRAMVKRV